MRSRRTIAGLAALGLGLAGLAAVHAWSRGRPTTLLFVGDVMLGRGVQQAMERDGDWTLPFRPLADRLRGAHLAFANLESVLATTGTFRGRYDFRGDPRAVAGLAWAGFDVVSVANNHAADWGPDALREMIQHLRRAGIAPVGLVADGGEQPPVILRAGPYSVGVLAYSYQVGAATDPLRIGRLDRERIVRDIAAGHGTVDYLVVSLHTGVEGAWRSGPVERDLAHAAIDAGADLVVGHHPHVPQEVEKYGRGVIAYSLGNFVFDHPQVSVDGAILVVTLRWGRSSTVDWVRTRINERYQPEAIGEVRWEASDLEGADRALN